MDTSAMRRLALVGALTVNAVCCAAETRPADDRPRYDDVALEAVGIRRYASRRLVLYSDIEPAIARTLPPLVDAAYPEWVKYFGELPPAADGSEFQLTGCLMRDRGLFLEMGLLPEDLIDFQHGRHRGYNFWMAEQKYDYYRRHLLIHEATHCFMMIVPSRSLPPQFYLEGMAELFGAHELTPDGPVFRVFPRDPNIAVGFGRIEMIQHACAQGDFRSLDDVLALDGNDFARSRAEPYAWSWALCKFLDAHPRYQSRFRELTVIREGGEFRREFARLFAADTEALRKEWRLYAWSLQYGYDIERAAIDFRGGAALKAGGAADAAVEAGRGWQSSGVLVTKGERYRCTASGRVTLANQPRPWLSEADGVTIRYAGGRPIGRLMGWIDPAVDPDGEEPAGKPHVFDLGADQSFEAGESGVLYLRVNDGWDSLADNQGAYKATLERASAPR